MDAHRAGSDRVGVPSVGVGVGASSVQRVGASGAERRHSAGPSRVIVLMSLKPLMLNVCHAVVPRDG